jgi:thiamine pyrophosphate-dependent acetolactate synthase large subunit-like protein
MTGEMEWGSDVVVEILKRYEVEYAPTNLGATFRGLLDSLINYGDNTSPEIIECLHEEIAVSIAAGYAKLTGKPAAALVHNVVGTMHASMAIYDAYVSKSPMIVMSGTGPMSMDGRRPWIDWVHTALVQGNLVRDYVKWDDQPHDTFSVPESLIRAYRVAMTEPKGPVYITLDAGWQEERIDREILIPDIAKFTPPAPVQADPTALAEVARLLAGANAPLIIAGRVGRNESVVADLLRLAEVGGIKVVDAGGAMNFPNTHPLDATGTNAIEQADVVILLDVDYPELATTVWNRYDRQIKNRLRPDAKLVNVGLNDLAMRSTVMDFGRLIPAEFSVAADTSVAIPALIPLLEAAISGSTAPAERAAEGTTAKAHARERAREEAGEHAGERPIPLSRIASSIWKNIKGDDNWVFSGALDGWNRRLWDIERPGSILGPGGSAALGTGLPRAVGAGLAVKKSGGYCVAIEGDGDMMYVPGTIWTAVHHNIPVLVIVRDNDGYKGEGEHVTWTSEHRERSTALKHVATEITGPNIDYAAIARAQGAYAEGPIEDPAELDAAIARALRVVKEQKTLALVTVRSD